MKEYVSALLNKCNGKMQFGKKTTNAKDLQFFWEVDLRRTVIVNFIFIIINMPVQ